MPDKTLGYVTALLCLCAVVAGCKDTAGNFKPKPTIEIPPHIKGTVAQYAALVGGGELPVQACGIVVGLGRNGSSQVPAHLRRSIIEYLAKHYIGSHRMGMGGLTPSQLLRDKDTSVVLVGGSIPPGAPVGTKFDLHVSAHPQTQTRSLEGGSLWPIDLSVAYGGLSNPNVATKIWAKAAGPVFVNPFADPADGNAAARALTGRIIGGGKVTRRQPIRLQLHRPDYQIATLIQQRIHSRFDPNDRLLLSKIVKGRSRSVVEISIPPDYREDYMHFLDLVMHLPIRFGRDGWETYGREVIKQMRMPAANHHGLAMVLEAMGRQIVPALQELYSSNTPAVAFHAARTGLRLGDAVAAEVILRYAITPNTPHQVAAIEELGRHPQVMRATGALRRLLDDRNDLVRIAAYQALLDRGDRGAVTSIEIPQQFTLDLVKTRGSHIIYAAQTKQPRIVLFGLAMEVRRPVYFEGADELITVNALSDTGKLTLFRKIPTTGQFSDPLEIDPSVRSLVVAMGKLPAPDDSGKVDSLGLTYGQVVGTLYRMCKDGDIRAKFVLQQSPALQRIYTGASAAGRPDMPG